MTAHQQTKLNELRSQYPHVDVCDESETKAIVVDCYAGGATRTTFRISPSGFRQQIVPVTT